MADPKLGKKTPTYDRRDLRWADLQNTSVIPNAPYYFGHGNSFTDWGMLGNDNYGDCVFAGSDHEHMLLSNLASGGATGFEPVKFTAENALADYGAVTGFDPQTGENDNGTEVRQALKYRKRTGLIDSTGKRHKISAYVAIEPGHLEHVINAAYVFEAVGIGFEFPASAMDQFNEGKVWSVVPGSSIEGGHYVPIVGRPAPGFLAVITWGKRQLMTEEFFKKYCDEAWTYITPDEINTRTEKNWGGFEWKQLQEFLKLVP